MLKYMFMLMLVGCGDDDEIKRCDDLQCIGLTCGTVTPDGVVNESACTCELAPDHYVSCEAR